MKTQYYVEKKLITCLLWLRFFKESPLSFNQVCVLLTPLYWEGGVSLLNGTITSHFLGVCHSLTRVTPEILGNSLLLDAAQRQVGIRLPYPRFHIERMLIARALTQSNNDSGILLQYILRLEDKDAAVMSVYALLSYCNAHGFLLKKVAPLIPVFNLVEEESQGLTLPSVLRAVKKWLLKNPHSGPYAAQFVEQVLATSLTCLSYPLLTLSLQLTLACRPILKRQYIMALFKKKLAEEKVCFSTLLSRYRMHDTWRYFLFEYGFIKHDPSTAYAMITFFNQVMQSGSIHALETEYDWLERWVIRSKKQDAARCTWLLPYLFESKQAKYLLAHFIYRAVISAHCIEKDSAVFMHYLLHAPRQWGGRLFHSVIHIVASQWKSEDVRHRFYMALANYAISHACGVLKKSKCRYKKAGIVSIFPHAVYAFTHSSQRAMRDYISALIQVLCIRSREEHVILLSHHLGMQYGMAFFEALLLEPHFTLDLQTTFIGDTAMSGYTQALDRHTPYYYEKRIKQLQRYVGSDVFQRRATPFFALYKAMEKCYFDTQLSIQDLCQYLSAQPRLVREIVWRIVFDEWHSLREKAHPVVFPSDLIAALPEQCIKQSDLILYFTESMPMRLWTVFFAHSTVLNCQDITVLPVLSSMLFDFTPLPHKRTQLRLYGHWQAFFSALGKITVLQRKKGFYVRTLQKRFIDNIASELVSLSVDHSVSLQWGNAQLTQWFTLIQKCMGEKVYVAVWESIVENLIYQSKRGDRRRGGECVFMRFPLGAHALCRVLSHLPSSVDTIRTWRYVLKGGGNRRFSYVSGIAHAMSLLPRVVRLFLWDKIYMLLRIARTAGSTTALSPSSTLYRMFSTQGWAQGHSLPLIGLLVQDMGSMALSKKEKQALIAHLYQQVVSGLQAIQRKREKQHRDDRNKTAPVPLWGEESHLSLAGFSKWAQLYLLKMYHFMYQSAQSGDMPLSAWLALLLQYEKQAKPFEKPLLDILYWKMGVRGSRTSVRLHYIWPGQCPRLPYAGKTIKMGWQEKHFSHAVTRLLQPSGQLRLPKSWLAPFVVYCYSHCLHHMRGIYSHPGTRRSTQHRTEMVSPSTSMSYKDLPVHFISIMALAAYCEEKTVWYALYTLLLSAITGCMHTHYVEIPYSMDWIRCFQPTTSLKVAMKNVVAFLRVYPGSKDRSPESHGGHACSLSMDGVSPFACLSPQDISVWVVCLWSRYHADFFCGTHIREKQALVRLIQYSDKQVYPHVTRYPALSRFVHAHCQAVTQKKNTGKEKKALCLAVTSSLFFRSQQGQTTNLRPSPPKSTPVPFVRSRL